MFWKRSILFLAIAIYFSPSAVMAEQNVFDLPGDISDGVVNDTLVNGDRCCLGKIGEDPTTCLYSVGATEDCKAGDVLVNSGCIEQVNNKVHPACSATQKATKPVSPDFSDIKDDLAVGKPVLSINIPNLKFSDVVSNTEDGKTFLYVPFIGEYLSAAYKVALVVISIVAVAMIIVTGIKITVMGGEAKVEGFKRIGQILVGLFIGWGSFTILSIVNPNLVNFQALKVQYTESQEIVFGDNTINESTESTGDAGYSEKFSECPVKMSSGPITKIGKNNKTVPDPAGNQPLKQEFVQKMLDNKILTGDFSNRAMLAAEAAYKCGIYFGTCGQGTTAIYALAGVNGSFGLDNKCLKQTCNMGGDSVIKKKTVRSVYSTKIGGVGVAKLLQGMLCAGVPVCKGAGWAVNWKDPCFTDSKAASNKLKEILKATGQWDEAQWFNDLKPGDYYDIANWNTTCSPTHSAMFLGWKDPVNHVAFQAGGDAGSFFHFSTHDFNKSGAVIIMIERPVGK